MVVDVRLLEAVVAAAAATLLVAAAAVERKSNTPSITDGKIKHVH